VKKRRPSSESYGGNARRTLFVYLGLFAVLLGAVGLQVRSALFFPWTARSRASAAGDAAAVYVVGGQNTYGSTLDDVLRVDTKTLRMRRVARLPQPLTGCEAVIVGDTLYVLGGYTGGSVVDTILRLDARRGQMVKAAQLPSPRAFGAVAIAGGRIYYFGGWDGSRVLGDIVVFDPGSAAAQTVGHLPAPRQLAAAVFFQGRILLVGGEGDGGEQCADALEIDPTAMLVLRATPMRRPPFHPRAAVVSGRIICFDGFSERPLAALSTLDPVTFDARAILAEPLPVRDPNLALAAGGDAAYLIGGADLGNPRQPAFIRISLPPKGQQTADSSSRITPQALRLRTFLLLR
jgi:N-acetylneuraminic acid mutarotase